ncbi:MAG: ComEC/Rec2 family competence protein, partial [Lentimicrobium sp.]|nr:ComEC/Rec2 family competence protein [Lentimicrobium sp.]
ASLMFSLITIGKSLNRQSHTYNTLAASAFILLIMNPGMLYDLGFQLSYAAVAGIVTFQPHIRKVYTPVNKVAGYIWDLTSVSIAAQLITAPISVYYFHQFPNYFLIANLIAIPLSGVMIYTGVAFIFLSIIPFLGKIIAVILIAQIKILNAVVSFVEGLPGAVSHDLYLSSLATIALFLLLFSILMWYLQKNKAWLFPVLILCLLLASDYAANAFRRMGNQTMIVQSINRHSAVIFTNGQTQKIIADSAIVENPQLLKYSTDSYRIRAGIRTISYVDIAGINPVESDFLYFNNGFFSFEGKRGVVLTHAMKLPATGKQIKVDYVILTDNVKYRLEKLVNCFPGACFIADASNSVRKCKTWGQEAVALKLRYYSVRESGAWIARF